MNDFLMGLLLGKRGGGGGDAHGIPSGGTTGQVLAKTSGTDYAAGWTTLKGIPSGGDKGTVLMKSSNSSYSTTWGTMMYNINLTTANNTYKIGTNPGDVAAEFNNGKIVRIFTNSGSVPRGVCVGYQQSYDDQSRPVYEMWFIASEVGKYNQRMLYYRSDADSQGYLTERDPGTHDVTASWIGTKNEYDALGTYDANTIYYIKE